MWLVPRWPIPPCRCAPLPGDRPTLGSHAKHPRPGPPPLPAQLPHHRPRARHQPRLVRVAGAVLPHRVPHSPRKPQARETRRAAPPPGRAVGAAFRGPRAACPLPAANAVCALGARPRRAPGLLSAAPHARPASANCAPAVRSSIAHRRNVHTARPRRAARTGRPTKAPRSNPNPPRPRRAPRPPPPAPAPQAPHRGGGRPRVPGVHRDKRLRGPPRAQPREPHVLLGQPGARGADEPPRRGGGGAAGGGQRAERAAGGGLGGRRGRAGARSAEWWCAAGGAVGRAGTDCHQAARERTRAPNAHQTRTADWWTFEPANQ
jgi:hypothetical protein